MDEETMFLISEPHPPHLEALGGLYEAGELRLGHRRLALVHEVHDALHFPSANVLQNDDRVLARVVDEDLLEIGARRRRKKGQIQVVRMYTLKLQV